MWLLWLIVEEKWVNAVYVENSYQILGGVDKYFGWPVNGNIICAAYLRS